jgi:hypothetical protein
VKSTLFNLEFMPCFTTCFVEIDGQCIGIVWRCCRGLGKRNKSSDAMAVSFSLGLEPFVSNLVLIRAGMSSCLKEGWFDRQVVLGEVAVKDRAVHGELRENHGGAEK